MPCIPDDADPPEAIAILDRWLPEHSAITRPTFRILLWETLTHQRGPVSARTVGQIEEDQAFDLISAFQPAMRLPSITGVELRGVRLSLGLSLTEMASMLAISERSIRRWETREGMKLDTAGLVDGLLRRHD